MRRVTATLVAVGTALALAGCGASYEEKATTCQKALATHDFDTEPLAAGERLPACKDITQDDYDDLLGQSVLDRLGWLDDEGNFDESKMLDSLS